MPAPPETLSTEFTFCNGALHDLEALYALDCVCFDEAFRFSRRQMRRYLQRKSAIVPVAETADGIAGFAIAHIDKKTAYLLTLDVAPTRRGRGLGQRLLELTELACADAGATVLWLHVWERNAAAIRLYERSGYQQRGIEPGFYPGGHDAFIYGKQLTRLAPTKSLP